MQSITNSKHTRQKDSWLEHLLPPAQSFINHFCDENTNDQLSDRIVFEKFKSALGNAYFPSTHDESVDPTQKLFEKSFNQWVFTLHEHAKLTPLQIEKAYNALHYDTVNLSTYSTDELAKLHAVLLEQYPEHYHSLLNEYNQIISSDVDDPCPITLDQEESFMQRPTESNVAKLSIFMICKLLSLIELPSPFITDSILFKKKYASNCDLDIDSAFRFYEDKLVSEEELSRLIDFSKNISDRSYTDKIEIFCESFIESIDLANAFKYSAGSFTCDTKKYQLLMTILLSLPLHSIKRIEFNFSCRLLDEIVLPRDELITSENSLTHTENFIECIGKNKLHWMFISLILCKSRPINSDNKDLSPLLEIINPILKTVSKFDHEFKSSQNRRFFISHIFIVNTFDLLYCIYRNAQISEKLFIDYCMVGKNHTLALNPIAALTEECEQILKDYRNLCEKISAEQEAILGFDKIKNQVKTGDNSFDLSAKVSSSESLTLNNHHTPMNNSNRQVSSYQNLSSSPDSFANFSTEGEVDTLHHPYSQSLFEFSSSSSPIETTSLTTDTHEYLQISQSEIIFFKKQLESFFSRPFDAQSPDQYLNFYGVFKHTYDTLKRSSLHSQAFFQPTSVDNPLYSQNKLLFIFSKLPDYIQEHILSSLHKIRMHQVDIIHCEKNHKKTLRKILRLHGNFLLNIKDLDIDSTIQSASMPFLSAQTQTLPMPICEAKTLKHALLLLEITKPNSTTADSYMDIDTQNMTTCEKTLEDYFQASVMIQMKNLGQSALLLLKSLYSSFPKQMENLRALLQKQYDSIISEMKGLNLEHNNKKASQSARIRPYKELHIENILLCGQDFAIKLHIYLSKTEVLNLITAIKSFSQSLLCKRPTREISVLKNRSYCFLPDEDNIRLSSKMPISPGIMSLLKTGAPNLTIRYGSPDKRNSTLFLPNRAPVKLIREITQSDYLHILFSSQRYFSVCLSESLIHKTLRELGYSNSSNTTSENLFSEISGQPIKPLVCKRLNTDQFEIDIYHSGKIIIRTTPNADKKAEDKESHPNTPIQTREMLCPLHIKKTKDFYRLLQKNFEKSLAPLEIIKASLSEDHLEVLCLNSYTLRYEIYHEFCSEPVRGIGRFSFPYQLGEIRIIDSKWPGRTHSRYPPIRATTEIIETYDLPNSPIKSWTFSDLTHTNRPSLNQRSLVRYHDNKEAMKKKIFSAFNVDMLPTDEDFFSHLAPLKFLQHLNFTHKVASSYKKSSRFSYVFAKDALAALLELPKLPALKSMSLTSGKEAINLRQCQHKINSLRKSLNEKEAHIACSKDQIKHAKKRIREIKKHLGKTQDSSASSPLKVELSALEDQIESTSSEEKAHKGKFSALKSEINTLKQGIEFIEGKTEECKNYATMILHENSSAKSSDFRQVHSLEDRYPKLQEIILDELTFTKRTSKWSTKHL